MRSRSLAALALVVTTSMFAPASYPQSPTSQPLDCQEAAGGKMQFDVASVKQGTHKQSPQTVHSNVTVPASPAISISSWSSCLNFRQGHSSNQTQRVPHYSRPLKNNSA
jgi:hypothetical protein